MRVLRIFACSVVFLTLGSVSVAQESGKRRACWDTAQSQTEMNGCADAELRAADMELNETYRRLLATVANNRRATAKIKAAELAWIRFRDAYLDATFPEEDKQANYGTVFPMEIALLQAKLTREQVGKLHDLLNSIQY